MPFFGLPNSTPPRLSAQVTALPPPHVAQREGRWGIVDLVGKGQPDAHSTNALLGEGSHR